MLINGQCCSPSTFNSGTDNELAFGIFQLFSCHCLSLIKVQTCIRNGINRMNKLERNIVAILIA